MTDRIIEEITAAQAATAEDYVVWAEVGSGGKEQDVVLHTVRLPQSIGTETVLSRLKSQAMQTLADCGFSADEIAAAALHISPLPSAEDTQAILDKGGCAGSELALVDLVGWEAIRIRFQLSPYEVANGEMEMDLNGLKIRRSAAD